MFTENDETYRLTAAPGAERKSGFPWRAIPTAVTALVGGLCATFIVPLIYVLIWNPVYRGETVPVAIIGIYGVFTVAGMIWIVAAAAWWHRYWMLASGMTLFAYIVLALLLPDR
jgi:hypothetical protein